MSLPFEWPVSAMPKGISKLESLRTLRASFFLLSLSMEEDGLLRLEDVCKMSKIEEIRFQVEHELQLKRIEPCMEVLHSKADGWVWQKPCFVLLFLD